MTEDIDLKKQILKWLKEFDRLPTSRFVGLLGVAYEKVNSLLDELVKEKKIRKEEETLATYWVLENENNNK